MDRCEGTKDDDPLTGPCDGSLGTGDGARRMAARTARALAWPVALALVALSPGAGRAGTANDLTAGSDHACLLNGSGGVECWGRNTSGQLGDGTGDFRLTPVGVTGLASGVLTVSAGGFHTCALTNAGGVKCWGAGGRLGDGSTAASPVPVDVTGLTGGVAAIDAGGAHACAVTDLGGLACWGGNTFGQLGDGTTTNATTPVDVAGLSSGVAAVAAGSFHTCALTTGGAVKCWGYNFYGQLGNGSTTNSSTPLDVVGLGSGVEAIAAGANMTCAITTGGGLQCWGENFSGNLGDGTVGHRSTPVAVVGLASGVASVAAPETAEAETCAVTTAGALKCWGFAASDNEPRDVRFHTSGVSEVVSGDQRWVRTTAGEVKAHLGGSRSGYGPLVGVAAPFARWESGCVFGYGDSDGDALCDTYDACTTLAPGQSVPESASSNPRPRMTLARIHADPVPGNDRLTLRARFELAPARSFAHLDPLANGARIVLVSPAGTTLSFPLPPGTYAGRGTAGWTFVGGNRPRWQFTDSTGAPGTRTVTRVKITDRGDGAAGGAVEVVATATAGTFDVTEQDLPLQTIILLDDAVAGGDGLCGEAVFNCDCVFNGSETTLACVNGPNRKTSCPKIF